MQFRLAESLHIAHVLRSLVAVLLARTGVASVWQPIRQPVAGGWSNCAAACTAQLH